ncbi:nitroreductase family protein [Chloroflexota bacterium]
MLKKLILSNRSYRRFHREYVISIDTLKELVDLARLSASGRNKQPLKFLLSCDAEKNAKIFPLIATWKGGIPEWPGPKESERPSAYIIILGDTEIRPSFGHDPGIAAQSILLGATEKGLGGCMMGSIKKEEARKVINIPSQYEILLTIALGKPNEKVVIETLKPGQDTTYWLEKDDSHHVPKRRLEDIIIL